ncbi:MAG: helix-turn-helix domain-containing protein [Hydrogenothermaceae bacterium]|nr:helix-turn-helix domain-containing protein [Hydrogenothermaceae bacterium]
MELGEVIKKKRESARLTIEDLSEKSSIPVKIIEKIEEDPEYIKTPYGKLQAKAIMKFLNIDYDIKINNTDTEVYKPSEKRYSNILIKSVKLIPHIAILVIFSIYIHATAKNSPSEPKVSLNNTVDIKPTLENQTDTSDSQKQIILKSNGDVWITASIDGEKKIFNIKEGEVKVITFTNKIAFETIGNVHQLIMVFDDKEISLKDKEIIHNVFVDGEGIFYNGYNLLRGMPKI